MPRPADQYEVAIVGGGITGLSAAWEIEQRRPGTRYALLERAERWGGKIVTHHFEIPAVGAFTGDAGPESFVTRKPEVWDLVHELGFEEALLAPPSETRHTFLYHHGRVVRLPLSPLAFIQSPLLSLSGKVRMLLEPLIPARRDQADESLAGFIERRLGSQASQNLIGPILAGIYNADPETQSILTTSPVMRAMEREHGSIFLGALASMRARRASKPGTGKPQFITIRGGAERLVQRLLRSLGGHRWAAAGVEQVDLLDGSYGLRLTDGRSLTAQALILATPANSTAKMLRGSFAGLAEKLDTIAHTNIGTLLLAYRPEQLRLQQPLFGLMIPRREGRQIDAITLPSAKLPGSAPPGHHLVRVFFGGASPELVELDEQSLIKKVREELRQILGVEEPPVGYALSRWPQAYPQARVGHLDLVEQIEASLPPRILLAGSSYRGLAVPDCIAQGRSAARTALQYLGGNTATNQILRS